MRYFRVKKWNEFQHYKDRNPPWIKFHTSTLSDYEFQRLSDKDQLDLLKIWLLAAVLDNRIPDDRNFVAQRIGSRKPPDLKALSEAGWLIEEPSPESSAEGETMPECHETGPPKASTALASCEQGASNVLALAPSREERQRRDRGEESAAASAVGLPNDAHREMAKRFGVDCAYEWEKFRDHEWKGRAPKDLNRAFRNWLRKAHEYASRDGRPATGARLDWGKVV